jgi:hypothetical protein
LRFARRGGWSDDLEMVEITSPTVYSTEEVEID